MSVEDLQKSLEDHVHKTYHEAERKLLPAPLVRERDFYGRVWLLTALAYSAPWLYFGLRSLVVLHDGPLWENWPAVWRMGLAILFGWYHAHSAKHANGLFYPLDIWEQSLSRRHEDWRAQNPEKAALLNRLQNPLSYM
jgi:hypothetical protein